MAEAKSQGVPHAQIVAYYKQHVSEYEHPEARDVQLLLTEGLSEAQRARDEIRSGKSFASVAKRVGNEPNSLGGISGSTEFIEGGVNKKYSVAGVRSTRDAEILERAIFSATEDVLTGPVRTPDAYYVLEAGKATPKQLTDPLQQVEAQIQQRLSEKHGNRMAGAFTQTLKARWKAKTDCAPGFVIPDCSQYRPPKATSKTSTPTPVQKERARERGLVEEAKSRSRSSARAPATINLNSRAIVQRGVLSRGRGNPERIATDYTCDAANISPPLQWGSVPRGTAELLVVVEESARGQARPDIVWTVAELSPSIHGIPAGSIPAGAVVGRNSVGRTAWGGICPPRGVERVYVFGIYALRKKLGLKPGFDLEQAGRRIDKGDLVAQGTLIGSYDRR